MTTRVFARSILASLVAPAALGVLAACGGSTPPPAGSSAANGGSMDPRQWPADDRSLCDWRNKPELEVSETAGPGALRPNVRRVYKSLGEGDTRQKVLICREIDSNLDGVKDVMRTFNAKGEALREEADRNFDGRIDIWLQFTAGRLAEEDEDTNGDGKADVWKYYTAGKLSRIKRDRNFDGQPDVWEIYNGGHLERMGLDESFDGHVDRWDRDEQMRAAAEAQERQAEQDAGASGASSAGGDSSAASGSDAGAADSGAAGTRDAGSAKGAVR